MKRWFYQSFRSDEDGHRDALARMAPFVKLLEFVNRNKLQPGEFLVVNAVEKDFSTLINIMYYAEHELE
jgi:hypothetical protein